MLEKPEHNRAEVITHQGRKYVRINPNDIDVSKMTLVQKVTDVVAAQVKQGRVKVVTKHGKDIETINYAVEGDWVVYDIGESDFKKMHQKILNSSKSAISKDNFSYLYKLVTSDLGLNGYDITLIIQDLLMDNDDNREFDGGFLNGLKRYQYIGKPVYAGYVPFNFCVRTPWGEDQFIKRGGLVIYDTNYERQLAKNPGASARSNLEAERTQVIYGIEGAKDRVAGEFEKTYSIAPTADKKVIADTFKIAIKADRSPIAGIQFNNIDLAKAYDRANKKMPDWLERFLPD
jgi:hypothetical protein